MDNLETQAEDERRKAGEKILAYLREKQKGECCLNLVACGPAKTGKSTLLNYILGPEPESCSKPSGASMFLNFILRRETDDIKKMNSKMLLTGHESETYLPWYFKATSDLEPDMIEVSHIDWLGNESPKKLFINLEEYKKFIKSLYSREAIIKKMTENKELLGQKPDQLINICYGIPSKTNAIWKELESGINMLDLQGLNEHGTDSTLKAIQGPFILFCCFSSCDGFFATEGFQTLKGIIENNSKIYHICFVATRVETSVRALMSDEDLDEATALKRVKEEVKRKLSECGLMVKIDLFFFDPNSTNIELRSEIKRIRQSLKDIKNQPAYYNAYKKKLKLMENNLTQRLEIEKKIFEAKVTCSQIFQDLQKFQTKWESYVDSLKTGLATTFKKCLTKNFIKKIKELAKNKKAVFMAGEPKEEDLLKNLNDWFLHDGYKSTVSELLTPKIEKFGKRLISVANSEFNFSFYGLDEQKDNVTLPADDSNFLTRPQRIQLQLIDLTWNCYNLAQSSIFLLDQMFLPVLTFPEFAFFLLLGYGVVKIGKKLALKKYKKQDPANFDAVLDAWCERIKIQEEPLARECEKVSELVILNAKKWGNQENSRLQFEIKNI